MDGDRLAAIHAWQLTTQTRHAIRARYFIDCSRNNMLAPLTGAVFRVGREARGERARIAATVVRGRLLVAGGAPASRRRRPAGDDGCATIAGRG